MKVVEEGILKRDIQMMMIAKEGIQKRRHILRRKKRTYIGSQMESGRPRDYPGETRMPRTIRTTRTP